MVFKDHFSGHAGDYARYRPVYPEALFDWLRVEVPAEAEVWDCACGSGQAARQLAARFRRVFATDASAHQIAAAGATPSNLSFAVAAAERSGLTDSSVDLICVAQALHWFDVEAFYAEVARVARPGALLAVWMYGSVRVEGIPKYVLERFEHEEMGPYWPPERAWIDSGYAAVRLPGTPLRVPSFEMTAQWPLADLLGYVGSWSSVRRFRRYRGADPLSRLRARLSPYWGDASAVRTVRWPLVVRATRLAAKH